jgi:phosphoribosylformimino-5-aminoimidazole carboxamide ribotide isomerase
VEATAELARAVPAVPVIASGGISSLNDVIRLAAHGVAGCIIGRALYEGQIDLAGAVAMTRFMGGSTLKEGGMTTTPPDRG